MAAHRGSACRRLGGIATVLIRPHSPPATSHQPLREAAHRRARTSAAQRQHPGASCTNASACRSWSSLFTSSVKFIRACRLRVKRVDGGHVDLLAREAFPRCRATAPGGRTASTTMSTGNTSSRELAPLGVDQALRLAVRDARDVRAVAAMDRDALAARDEADDRIGRRGLAAARERGHQPVDADDQDAAAGSPALRWRVDDFGLGARRRRRPRPARARRGSLPARCLRVDLVARQRREQLVGAWRSPPSRRPRRA